MLYAFLLLLVMRVSSSQTLYDPSIYYLGSNLIINPDFAEPQISPLVDNELYNNGINGWNCTTKCQLKKIVPYYTSKGKICNTNFSQGMDLDSSSFF